MIAMQALQQHAALSGILQLLGQTERFRDAALVSQAFRTAANTATKDLTAKFGYNGDKQAKLDSFGSWIQQPGTAANISSLTLSVYQQGYNSIPHDLALPWNQMSNLTVLTLSNVTLSEENIKQLPDHLTKLDLQTAGTTAVIQPHVSVLTNLKHLSLRGGKQATDDNYKAISSTLQQLTHLSLDNCDLTDANLAALLPGLQQLQELDISQHGRNLDSGHLAALLEPLTSLTKLYLHGASPLAATAQLGGLRNIQDLKLVITFADASPLAALTSLTHLHMQCWGCKSAEAAEGFLQVLPQLPNLQYLQLDLLDFARHKIPPTAFNAIPQISGLTRLDLIDCEMPKGAANKGLFAKAKCLAQLKHLHIKNVFNYFWCDDDAYRFRQSPVPNLVSAADIRRVAAACPDLVTLDLNIPICTGTSAGLTALAKLKRLSKFTWCTDKEYCNVDGGLSEGLKQVKARWPNITWEQPDWWEGDERPYAHVIEFK